MKIIPFSPPPKKSPEDLRWMKILLAAGLGYHPGKMRLGIRIKDQDGKVIDGYWGS
jgi:hypothetical protein